MTKRYRLLKDYPGAEAGDIYELDRLWLDNKSRIAITVELGWLKTHPDYFEEIKEQEWKIMTCLNNKTEAWQEKDWHWYVSPEDKTTLSCCIKDKCRIRSVMRLSDKQLFSIGDEVCSLNSWIDRLGAITEFRIVDGEMGVVTKDGMTKLSLVKKCPIKEEQPFQWSDELVYEFGIYNTTHPWVATNLQDFKKSKQQTNTIPLGEKYKQWDIPMNATIKESQPKTERMSVIYFEFDLDKKWLKLHFNKLELSVKKDYSKIKNSIEKILNNE